MKNCVIIADILSVNMDGKSMGHYLSVAQNYNNILTDNFEVKIAGGPIYYNKFSKVLRLKYDTQVNKNGLVNKIHALKNGLQLILNTTDSYIIFQCSAVSTILLILMITKPKATIFLIQYDEMINNSKLKKVMFSIVKKKNTRGSLLWR